MPKVSVVIPSYNHAAYIREAVDSVLGQTCRDLELVVVDDGSRDNSLELLRAYRDPRLRLIAQANQGAHAAINRGLAEASGEVLAILNSDDAYHLQRLEKATAALEARPDVGLLGTHIEIIDTQGNRLGVKHGYHDCEPWLLEQPERSFRAGDDLHRALLTENYLATTSNYVFTRAVYERAGEFRPLRYAHDWDFALRAARLAPLALLPEPLLRYRVHASNTIRENQAAMVLEICWVLAVHLPQYPGEMNADLLDGLLHSIYTYGCERVLSAMLLQRLHHDMPAALRLLQPADPTRQAYLDYIAARLEAAGAPPPAPRPVSPLRRVLKKLLPAAVIERLRSL